MGDPMHSRRGTSRQSGKTLEASQQIANLIEAAIAAERQATVEYLTRAAQSIPGLIEVLSPSPDTRRSLEAMGTMLTDYADLIAEGDHRL